MLFALDLNSGTPIYLQLKDQIRYAISVGELRPGDALPSIRKLEAELGVNRNTIRRAYMELQHEGTLVIRQGKEAEVSLRASEPRRKTSAWVVAFAQKMVQEIESKGVDSIQFASIFERAAIDHDAHYPKCVFVECSQSQADDFANAAEAAWHRKVIGIDLDRLREDIESIPASAKYALTTHWHLAEVKKLLKDQIELVQEMSVRLSQSFYDGVVRLEGLKTGLILRDPESVAGYRELVRKRAKVKGAMSVVLMREREKAPELMNIVEGIVYTTPCRDFVREYAPPQLVTQELLYEPVPDDLARLKGELFPS